MPTPRSLHGLARLAIAERHVSDRRSVVDQLRHAAPQASTPPTRQRPSPRLMRMNITIEEGSNLVVENTRASHSYRSHCRPAIGAGPEKWNTSTGVNMSTLNRNRTLASRIIGRDRPPVEAVVPAKSLVNVLCLGGTGGIRTPGTFQFVRFQGGCIRPLCHRSVFHDTGLCCVLPGEVPERPNGMPC